MALGAVGLAGMTDVVGGFEEEHRELRDAALALGSVRSAVLAVEAEAAATPDRANERVDEGHQRRRASFRELVGQSLTEESAALTRARSHWERTASTLRRAQRPSSSVTAAQAASVSAALHAADDELQVARDPRHCRR